MAQSVIKIGLSIAFLLCLLDMGYGYYQAVRFAGMLGFTLLAYFGYEQKKNIEIIIYVGLALIFQPFVKVALGRMVWNVVDIVLAVGLIGSFFLEKKFKNVRT